MPKIQNNFLQGIINKDLDERLVPNGQLTDAVNFMVSSEENGNKGVGKPVYGNAFLNSLVPTQDNQECIGGLADEGKERLFIFLTGDDFDYVLKYDTITNTPTIILQDTKGRLLNFSKDYRISHANLFVSVEDSDLLSWTDGLNPPRIINTERIYPLDGFTESEISVIKPAPMLPPTLDTSSSGILIPQGDNAETNEIEDRFVSFAYRWKYQDGYYSSFSPFSEYFFIPRLYDVNYDSMENDGMVNAINYCRVSFNSGNRDVIGVDVLFKYEGLPNVYILDKYDKQDKGWSDNTIEKVVFFNNKRYSVLPESQWFRSFDNVPLTALSQERVGNRLVYGNYVEGRNMIDEDGEKVIPNYTLDLISTDILSQSTNISYINNGLSAVVSFSDETQFKEGLTINIKINIAFSDEDIQEYVLDSFYILESDFSDLQDFLTNSGFVDFIETDVTNDYTDFINDNVPYTAVTVVSGFVFSQSSSQIAEQDFQIDFPVVTYEEDTEEKQLAQSIDVFNLSFGDNFGKSLKSNRSYEIGIIYKDIQGRKTTVFTSDTNTIFIPHELADKKNVLKVTFPDGYKHPEWAYAYQFVIKQNRTEYQTIFSNIFYKDGIFRWVKLEGESKNKVKDGDTLIVKQDLNGFNPSLLKLKVLDVKDEQKDFIEGNEDLGGQEIVEDSGLYMKLRPPVGMAFDYEENTFVTYEGNQHLRYPTRCITSPNFPQSGITSGSVVRLLIDIQARGSIAFRHTYDRTFRVSDNYNSIQDWFNAEVENLGSFGKDYTWNGVSDIGSNIGGQGAGMADQWNMNSGWGFIGDNSLGTLQFFVVPFRKGTASRNISTTVKFEIRESAGDLIFETEPKIDNSDIYFETPQVYYCANNQKEHLLTRTYNCISFGNGVESNRYKDRFNATPFYIDFFPTSVSEDEYRQIDRYADLTWSGVYQESTNVNRLNEFNLSLANFKDDLEKKYGSIIRLDGDETDLMVIQEDRTSKVLYQKDLLYNADATTNLSRIEQVFGQQVMYAGDYGISTHPESYADYATNSFWVDVNRGVIVRFNSSNGLLPISKFGLNEYFRELFRDRVITNIIAEYDAFYDLYLLNIKLSDGYETWVYSPDNNGWLCRQTFNPQKMIRLNNKLFSLNQDGLWEHNVGSVNTFYDVYSDSSFAFNFSQEPSSRKIFKTISIEGDAGWNMNLTTDLQTGVINASDFIRKEGVFFSHIRGNEWNVDFANKSVVGLGNLVSVTGNTISVVEVSNQVSIGDRVYNVLGQLVGTINDINGVELSLTPSPPNVSLPNLSPNVFLVAAKNASVETSGLVGYYMNAQCSASPNNISTVFAINTDVSKSFE